MSSEPPIKRGRGRPRGSGIRPLIASVDSHEAVGKSKRSGIAKTKTPRNPPRRTGDSHSPYRSPNGDLSARRKSARTLIERTISGVISGDEDFDQEDELAERILNDEEDSEDEPEERLPGNVDNNLETASKRLRGRPRGARRKRSPTPQDLPSHEQYVFQNRPRGAKTSNNTLSSISLLNHEDYFTLIQSYVDPHLRERHHLELLHSRSFGQWTFELNEALNICLYGWGSKRNLVMKYAEWLHEKTTAAGYGQGPVIVVNGYTQTLTIRDIFNTIASAILGPNHGRKLGSQPAEVLNSVLSLLSNLKTEDPITLIVHSIDSTVLRRPGVQPLLAQLASHKALRLLATADHPSFALLWDSGLREQFNFVFHDCTTFHPYDLETDVVNDVHELLGRSGRRIGGKEGVSFVLKSLPENAKNLYRVLISEQLSAMEDSSDAEDEAGNTPTPQTISNSLRSEGSGIEYRILYQKALEEFICSSEMAFRTLLKEYASSSPLYIFEKYSLAKSPIRFHDHQMLSSRKDVLGTEYLWVPFSKEELESILVDLI
ncbi:MAG: Origin recognition complex subunit 2 [Trizodia sp. TS-e1964]|nr:MAG: Origin recognition complex subunit 2 [Trizodia sp. TS-e1964]